MQQFIDDYPYKRNHLHKTNRRQVQRNPNTSCHPPIHTAKLGGLYPTTCSSYPQNSGRPPIPPSYISLARCGSIKYACPQRTIKSHLFTTPRWCRDSKKTAYKKKHESRVEDTQNLYHMHDDTSAFSDGVCLVHFPADCMLT